ncbi:restriction endonuclease subunit S [Silanimonas algicola]
MDGWRITSLGSVCEFRGGGTPSKAVENYWRGDIPWVSPKDMKSKVVADSIDHISAAAVTSSATSIVEPGAVLMVVRSGILARTVPIAVAGKALALNQDIKALCPRGSIDSWFLYYLLESKMPELLALVSRGATVHRLITDQVRAVTFGMPPLPEQRRIVAILDEAFEAIAIAKANAEKNLQNAREVFRNNREMMLAGTAPGWASAPLRDLCEIKHGYAFEGEFFAQDGDYVLLTPGNYYESGGYRDRGGKQKYFVGAIPQDFVLSEGDLLVAMTEQAAGLLGSPLLVPESDRYLHNQRLGLVVGKPGVVWSNAFFFHVFNLGRVRSEIHASASGVKVRHTSPSKIGAVRVAFPTTLAEQLKVASSLDALIVACEELALVNQRKLAALDELKRSLLHQAFTGQLTAKSTDHQLEAVA